MDNREKEALRELTEAARGFIDGKPKTLRRLRNATTEAERALAEARAAIEGEPDAAIERLNEQWKARCLVLMGDKDKLKAEISRLNAERVLEAAPRKRDELCSTCGGNGSLKIPGGIEVCPACDGRCWA